MDLSLMHSLLAPARALLNAQRSLSLTTLRNLRQALALLRGNGRWRRCCSS